MMVRTILHKNIFFRLMVVIKRWHAILMETVIWILPVLLFLQTMHVSPKRDLFIWRIRAILNFNPLVFLKPGWEDGLRWMLRILMETEKLILCWEIFL